MQFYKFDSLLQSRALFFCRLDQFDDPWEGLVTEKMIDQKRLIDAFGRESASDAAAKADKHIQNLRAIQKHRDEIAASCWHMNTQESASFWRAYSCLDEGVAVRSTAQKLEAALARTRRDVVISKITYLDYRTELFDPGNCFNYALCKRDSFAHEQELRALAHMDGTPFATATGEEVPIDVDILISQVVVSPRAPESFFNDVRQLIRRRGFDFPCTRSRILRPIQSA